MMAVLDFAMLVGGYARLCYWMLILDNGDHTLLTNCITNTSSICFLVWRISYNKLWTKNVFIWTEPLVEQLRVVVFSLSFHTSGHTSIGWGGKWEHCLKTWAKGTRKIVCMRKMLLYLQLGRCDLLHHFTPALNPLESWWAVLPDPNLKGFIKLQITWKNSWRKFPPPPRYSKPTCNFLGPPHYLQITLTLQLLLTTSTTPPLNPIYLQRWWRWVKGEEQAL